MIFFLKKLKYPHVICVAILRYSRNKFVLSLRAKRLVLWSCYFWENHIFNGLYWGNNNATLPLLVYNVIWVTPSTVESIKDLEAWMKLPTSRFSSSRTTISSDIHYQNNNRWPIWMPTPPTLRVNRVSGAMDCPSVQTQPPI